MSIFQIIAAILVVLLAGYLIYALIQPEDF
ncbi:K(+)-transporting ATPase subunit F [Undibacterium squillarum]|nr:K(+)-transporting ATPase subunit F [Undibacterium squillarum]